MYDIYVQSKQLKTVVGAAFEAYGAINIVAVHLHAHDLTKGMRLEHVRDGKTIGTFGVKEPYVAHGPDQTFLNMPASDAARPVLPGDDLRLVCTVNTSSVAHDVKYGISHDTEMCATLIMYTGHNPYQKHSYPDGNSLGYI